jgi:hypothetical protein
VSKNSKGPKGKPFSYIKNQYYFRFLSITFFFLLSQFLSSFHFLFPPKDICLCIFHLKTFCPSFLCHLGFCLCPSSFSFHHFFLSLVVLLSSFLFHVLYSCSHVSSCKCCNDESLSKKLCCNDVLDLFHEMLIKSIPR